MEWCKNAFSGYGNYHFLSVLTRDHSIFMETIFLPCSATDCLYNSIALTSATHVIFCCECFGVLGMFLWMRPKETLTISWHFILLIKCPSTCHTSSYWFYKAILDFPSWDIVSYQNTDHNCWREGKCHCVPDLCEISQDRRLVFLF